MLEDFQIARTRDEVAAIIEDFVSGAGGAWDWDDFTSIPIKDSALDAVRIKCDLMHSLYPGTKTEWCNEYGRAVLRELAANLRSTKPIG